MSDHLQNHPPSLIWVSGDAILSLRLMSSMRPLLLQFQAFRIRTSRSETSQPLHDRTNLYTDLWNPTQQKVQDFRDEKFQIVTKRLRNLRSRRRNFTTTLTNSLVSYYSIHVQPCRSTRCIALPPVGTRKSKTPRVFASTPSLTHHRCKDGACRDPFHLPGMSLKTLMFLISSFPIPPHIYWSSVRL